MEKLFCALNALHPGYEVVDVRFMPSGGNLGDCSLETIDAQLAAAVGSARPLDVTTLN